MRRSSRGGTGRSRGDCIHGLSDEFVACSSTQGFKSSFGNLQLSYDWSIWVVDFWATVVMSLVIVMLSLLPAASFLQVSVVFVGVSRAQEQGTGRSPSPSPEERET